MQKTGVEEAIKALYDVARQNELLGYGSLPPVAQRVAAARALGKYVPHVDAVRALRDIMNQSWAPDELRLAATQALGMV